MLDGCTAKLCDGVKKVNESERNTGDLEYLKEFRAVIAHFPRKETARYFELYFHWL